MDLSKITADEYNDICQDILHDYLHSFTLESGLIRPIADDEENCFDEWVTHVYTEEGMSLYQSAREKLINLGKKYFHEDDLYIESNEISWA